MVIFFANYLNPTIKTQNVFYINNQMDQCKFWWAHLSGIYYLYHVQSGFAWYICPCPRLGYINITITYSFLSTAKTHAKHHIGNLDKNMVFYWLKLSMASYLITLNKCCIIFSMQSKFWSTARVRSQPYSFLSSINDIADGVQSQLYLFRWLYNTICMNFPEDHEILQQDLNKWAKTWQMDLSKCYKMSHLHTTSNFAYAMCDTKLNTLGSRLMTHLLYLERWTMSVILTKKIIANTQTS